MHLLHGERGPVVEALVARTLRLVESSQSMIRIVGLSATLPNYIDVSNFLRVQPMKGLFYFDSRFRPVPLDSNFIGVKSVKPLQQIIDMDQICYQKCVEQLQNGHQIMIFVHARNATVRTATTMREMANTNNTNGLFLPSEGSAGYMLAKKAIQKSNNKQLVELFSAGLAIHHAGMLRTDRQLVEKYFSEGYIKVLVCTATLAWGVNLPAHAVIIKGEIDYFLKSLKVEKCLFLIFYSALQYFNKLFYLLPFVLVFPLLVIYFLLSFLVIIVDYKKILQFSILFYFDLLLRLFDMS